MGFCYDMTAIFSLWDPPLPPVDCDGIRMEAYQPSVAGPVFHAKGDTMIRVKDFRFSRAKFNVYQFLSLYCSPVPCVVVPVLIFQKYDDWTWWIGLFLMLNFWIWLGGIILSSFVTCWVLGCIHGVRQRPLLTMRKRAIKLYKVFFSSDWDIKGKDGVPLCETLAASAIEADAAAAEGQGAPDPAHAEHLEAGLAHAQERASLAEARASVAEARASGAEAQVAELQARLDTLAPSQPSMIARRAMFPLAL